MDGQCSVEEGNIPTGTHRSLRFSVLVNNIGDADLYVGDPLAHMDPNGDGNFADQDGLFEFASCHAHFHFRNYATYEILRVNADGSLGAPVQARKRGFCMLDTTPWAQDGTAPKARYYTQLRQPDHPWQPGHQHGLWRHVRQAAARPALPAVGPQRAGPPRQVRDPRDGQPGVRADGSGEVCPAKDPQGLCHMFREPRYDNNVGEIVIEIPNRVGRTGYGPGAGQFNGEELDAYHHPEAHGSH